MVVAIVVAFVLILAGLKPAGKGLVLGTIFSVINFVLIGQTLPLKLSQTKRKTFVISLGSIFFRYALLATPLILRRGAGRQANRAADRWLGEKRFHPELARVLPHLLPRGRRLKVTGGFQHLGKQVDVSYRVQEEPRPAQYPAHCPLDSVSGITVPEKYSNKSVKSFCLPKSNNAPIRQVAT